MISSLGVDSSRGIDVLVLLDHDGTALRPTALELLTLARRVAGDGLVRGLWVGDGFEESREQVLALAGAHGGDEVAPIRTSIDAKLTSTLTDAVHMVLSARPAPLLLAVSTFENKELAARLAVRAGAGVVTDATSVEIDADGRVVAGKVVLAGSWATRCAVTAPLAVITVRPHALQAERSDRAPASSPDSFLLSDASTRAVTVVSRTPRPVSGPSLAEAEVVVVGGRGTDGDFSPVRELAEVLGGAVGATRVATDEGWIGHEAQIGQTGVTISPRLYVGAGVSGAVHHRGGMDASVTIVAINNDPDAPIFEFCDYGVVGDLGEVLSALSAELRRRRA
ncbi:MAG: electron transfer flavoprotein subunit alpha/FixB family protein [Janthinobacterium lividum]